MAAAPLTEGPGTVVGRYKLLQKIGEGGMGVVYMAEQREPVIRKVALKIIKLGMDTRQVLGRFEAERQALALMDHPNIAKILDGGATDTGRPYFVMDLEPVIARPPSTVYRLQKALRRNKLFFAAASAVALTLIASLSFSTRSFLRERKAHASEAEQRRIAVEERSKAEAGESSARHLLYGATMNLARQAWDRHPLLAALFHFGSLRSPP